MRQVLFSSHHLCVHLIRPYANGPATHYDVLNLKRDCTTEEIREAFIKLSKEFHPDVKGAKADPKSTAKFVQISEAYQVLSKPSSRSAYDYHLLVRSGHQRTTSSGGFKTEIHKPWDIKPDYDPNPGPYYGIRGLKKVSNGKIVMILLAFAVVGVGLGFFSAVHSVAFSRNLLDERSKKAGEHLAAVRANAHKFGNDEQLKRIVDKLLSKSR